MRGRQNPETPIINEICYGLGMFQAQAKIKVYHMYVGGIWNTSANCFQKTGPFHPRGLSDIMVLANGGRTFFIEAKCPGKKQEESQIEFQQTVEPLGFTYAIAHNATEARDVLRRAKIL